jgi:LysM repeat protein
MSSEVPAVAEEAGISLDPIDIGAGSEDATPSTPPAKPRRHGSWRRAFARLVALLALAAVGVALYLIITTTLNPSTKPAAPVHRTTVKVTVHHVRPGDSLATIAARYHTTVASLQSLNPNINPQAIRPGQALRVQVQVTATR